MMTNDIREKIVARYPLASASNRFFSRLLDLFLVLAVIVGLAFALICTDPGFKTLKDPIILAETWRYFLIAVLSAILFFSYFILLPYFWKGQTLMKKLFKLTSYNLISTESFFKGLLKHELFIWILIICINLILGVTLWTVGSQNAALLISNLSFFNKTNDANSTIYIVAIVFSTFYLINALINVGLAVMLFIRNKKTNMIDNFSNIVVIKLVDISSNDSNVSANKKKTKNKINYGLPGEISTGIIEEIQEF